MGGSGGTPEADAVFQVTGIPASEILRRCAELRAGRADGRAKRRGPFTGNAERPTWRLLDFAEGSVEEFVRSAYAGLLCRHPSEAESTRRIDALRTGSSRFRVLVSLALSAEGRQARDQPVSGVALPVLVTVGRTVERVVRVPVVGPALRRAKRKVSRSSNGDVSRRRAS